MKTVIALTLILVVVAQATYWNQIRPIQPYRDAIRKFQAYLMNGREVAPSGPGLLPYQVLISNRRKFCVGSLIKEDKVLTAAQCCYGGRFFRIVLGGNNLHIDEPSRQIVWPTKATIHESYNPSTFENDICIIHLDFPVSGQGIAPVRLPSCCLLSETFAGRTATISGWELTSDGESSTITAQLVRRNVTVLENGVCRLAYPIDSSKTICAKGISGICNGDAGGPLTITECDGVETQIGIASFGPPLVHGGCRSNYPDGYTRITEYIDWIKKMA
ncbi:Hypothetical predicted protein [Cloeon dipterum]|uniref:Peptidase S1 domain-containing protein n=1 Tax=Cloeon dipterum TaxID=197152 RepID=A0A8S1EFB7_9INSE|nr:Hypothetical predicted protein [Cloeon dipterum]